MDHELLDQKGDFFLDRDDTFSSLKHEFSRIFHENNLQSFTNASDIGFLELGKLASTGYPVDYEDVRGLGDVDNVCGRPYQKEEVSPYMGMGMGIHNSYSPMRFLQPSLSSNVSYNNAFSNPNNLTQKQMPSQDAAMYQQYQQYKYPDYYSDYTGQQNNLFAQNIYDVYGQQDILDTHPNNPLSMMWSNEVNKSSNKKISNVDDYLQQPSQNPGIKRYPSEQEMTRKAPLKIEQDFEKVSNKTLGLQLDRATKTMPDGSAQAPRRTNRITKPLYNVNMLAEDVEDSGSEDDKDESFGDSKNRSSRGLRVLSLKVRDIVSKKKKTSYKEVAEALLQDLSQKLKGKSQSEISKEEQNVKRRVYDALNVLIAADILRKEGKLVCCETSNASYGAQSKKKLKYDKESLIEQIQEIKRRKKEKVEALQELVFKSLAIKNLIRRNKSKAEMELLEEKNNPMLAMKRNLYSQNVSATRIDVVQDNASLQPKTQDVIRFPFIVLLSSSPENSMNLNMDTSQRQLSIESKKEFNIFGDIDVLLKMRLHYVPKETFVKEVPKELQKYVSQSFVDSLK